MFLRAEQTGLKLAIIGRIVALVLLGVWLVASRATRPGDVRSIIWSSYRSSPPWAWLTTS